MAFGGAEQAAIIELMHGKYSALLGIETEWGIRLHEGDWRPRIEYFHDAVRALTSGSADMYRKNSRLSVENLAYDLAQLRQIPARPLGLIHRGTEKSPGSALVKQGDAGAGVPKLPPQAVRGQIAAFYRDYTVFSAALFAPVADVNFQSRSDGIDSAVSDLAQVEQVLAQLAAGKITQATAMAELMQVERDDLRERLQASLANSKLTAQERAAMKALLGQISRGLDAEQKRLGEAHMHYATGRLAVYEEGKETIKRLQQQGLNLAGRFVENALQQSAGKGKGREF